MKLPHVNTSPKPLELKPFALTAMLAALTTIPGAALAQTAERDTITPAFHETIPNIQGKSIVAVVVNYSLGGKTPPHHHASSAFVSGYVVSGSIRSQRDDGQVQVFHAGESWSEKPGAHHGISENASTTEPAKLLAIFVVGTNDTELTTIERQ